MLARAPRKGTIRLDTFRILTFAVPALLLTGAFGSEVIGGLHPCEMCIWQRWPHGIAIALVLVAMILQSRPRVSHRVTLLAVVAIAISGMIGVFHAGVEQGWWEGVTTCTGAATSLEDLMNAPLVRCDEIQWTFLGLSLASWNAVFSLGGAAALSYIGLKKVTE